jgi:hypothetical protein
VSVLTNSSFSAVGFGLRLVGDQFSRGDSPAATAVRRGNFATSSRPRARWRPVDSIFAAVRHDRLALLGQRDEQVLGFQLRVVLLLRQLDRPRGPPRAPFSVYLLMFIVSSSTNP